MKLRLRSQGLVLRTQGVGLRTQGSGLRIQGSGLRAQGSGFRRPMAFGYYIRCPVSLSTTCDALQTPSL